MRRAAIAVAAFAVVALTVLGCGTKVPGVPGTVAKVNGKPISSSTYLEQLSRRMGQDVLRNLIEQRIVAQWADEEKVAPTRKQIQQQIKMLKEQGAYEDQAKMMGEDNLMSQIETAQARINLAKKFTKITPEQLQEVYDNPQVKQRYVHGRRKQVDIIVNSDSSKLEEALKKIKDGASFGDVAAEYGDRRYSANGSIKIWVDLDESSGMFPSVVKAAKKTKVGKVSEVLPLGQTGSPSQSAILEVVQEQPKANKPLKEVKSEIEDMAALQNAQMDPVFIRKLNTQLKDAKIEINIKEFKDLAYGFKNPPEPSPTMVSPGPARAPKSAKPK